MGVSKFSFFCLYVCCVRVPIFDIGTWFLDTVFLGIMFRDVWCWFQYTHWKNLRANFHDFWWYFQWISSNFSKQKTTISKFFQHRLKIILKHGDQHGCASKCRTVRFLRNNRYMFKISMKKKTVFHCSYFLFLMM